MSEALPREAGVGVGKTREGKVEDAVCAITDTMFAAVPARMRESQWAVCMIVRD